LLLHLTLDQALSHNSHNGPALLPPLLLLLPPLLLLLPPPPLLPLLPPLLPSCPLCCAASFYHPLAGVAVVRCARREHVKVQHD
jgi:hypothetical protein